MMNSQDLQLRLRTYWLILCSLTNQSCSLIFTAPNLHSNNTHHVSNKILLMNIISEKMVNIKYRFADPNEIKIEITFYIRFIHDINIDE